MDKKKKTTSIDWFNIKSGEEVLTSRPAQIKALIESSDLGVNRQSDRGWRLGKEWTKRLRAARTDRKLMAELSTLSGGEVTDTQLLVSLFNTERQADKQAKLYQEDNKFEQQYLDSIKAKNSN